MFYLGIWHRCQQYQRIPVRMEEEPNAWMFGLSIARDMASRGGAWSVTLYRTDGTPVDRWHQNNTSDDEETPRHD